MLRNDPMVVACPLFLLGLPLTLIFPPYLLLLLIPAWRNRSDGTINVIVDHLLRGRSTCRNIRAMKIKGLGQLIQKPQDQWTLVITECGGFPAASITGAIPRAPKS